MRHRVFMAAAFVLPAALACGPANAPTPMPGPDRILAVDRDGKVIRQSTVDEHFRVTFDAPMARVWRAVVVSYAELGIDPTVADRAQGRYGNESFIVPRRFMGRPITEIFRCGSGLTGPNVERGRVVADVVSTLNSASDSSTVVFTHVASRVFSNEGTSTEPMFCPSSGIIETELQAAITRNLAALK
jgi:hypothetical protein